MPLLLHACAVPARLPTRRALGALGPSLPFSALPDILLTVCARSTHHLPPCSLVSSTTDFAVVPQRSLLSSSAHMCLRLPFSCVLQARFHNAPCACIMCKMHRNAWRAFLLAGITGSSGCLCGARGRLGTQPRCSGSTQTGQYAYVPSCIISQAFADDRYLNVRAGRDFGGAFVNLADKSSCCCFVSTTSVHCMW